MTPSVFVSSTNRLFGSVYSWFEANELRFGERKRASSRFQRFCWNRNSRGKEKKGVEINNKRAGCGKAIFASF